MPIVLLPAGGCAVIAGVIYLQYTSRPTVQIAGSAVVSFIRFVDQVHRFAPRTLSAQHLLRHVRAAQSGNALGDRLATVRGRLVADLSRGRASDRFVGDRAQLLNVASRLGANLVVRGTDEQQLQKVLAERDTNNPTRATYKED